MLIIGGVLAAVIGIWFVRNIFGFIILFVFAAAFLGSGAESNSAPNVLTYQELVDYPSQCSKAREQLAELKRIQQIKNFDPDPDNLSDADRAYNSRLKASIWWYSYRCEQ